MNPFDGLCEQEKRDFNPGICPALGLGTNDVRFHFRDNGGNLERISVRSEVGTVEVKDLKKDVGKRNRHAHYGDCAAE